MIAAAMLYVLTIGAATSVAAWAMERLLARRGIFRRFTWIGALLSSVMLPVILMATSSTLSTTEIARPAADSFPRVTLLSGESAPIKMLAKGKTAPSVTRAWPKWSRLDRPLIYGWVSVSTVLALWLIGTASVLARRMRQWPLEKLDGQIVRVTDHTGPAVCGAIVPSVIVPQWVIRAPKSVRELVLLHEQLHVQARDPLLFRLALALVVLLPWNLPLWWQLRRLRFSIEVDCDARVLKAMDRDPVTYGEVLFAIGQHHSKLPIGAMALNESTGQLERRIKIMMLGKPRTSALVTGSLALLIGGVIACAATVEAPALRNDAATAQSAPPDLHIPPPKWLDLRWAQIDASLQSLLENRYSQLLNYDGNEIPLIEVLFKPDGSVERSELRMLENKEQLIYTNVLFENSGAKIEDVAYVQPRDLQPPPPARRVRFHFGERKNVNNAYAYVNSLGDAGIDVLAQDRAILTRYFPDVAHDNVTGGPILWVLLDRKGIVLENGREAASPELNNSSGITKKVIARFPVIRTSEFRMGTVSDASGKPLRDSKGNYVILSYLWLDLASPMPGSWARGDNG